MILQIEIDDTNIKILGQVFSDPVAQITSWVTSGVNAHVREFVGRETAKAISEGKGYKDIAELVDVVIDKNPQIEPIEPAPGEPQ